MFSEYKAMLSKTGGTNEREAIRHHSIITKEINFTNTQSYKSVKINGVYYDARIIEDVDDTIKTGNGNYQIEFRDKERFYPGTYIEIENHYGEIDIWLIIDTLDDLLFPKSIIKKCVYNLKWVNKFGEIIERWIALDDSYKLYDGIRNYGYKTNLPEGSIVALIPYDKETKNINRDFRFLIDDPTVEETPDAYIVTNRNALSRIGANYNYGIINLALTQDQFNPITDNKEMMIANYYNHPADDNIILPPSFEPTIRMEIEYTGLNQIVMDTPHKSFKCVYYDNYDEILDGHTCKWEVLCLPEFSKEIDFIVEGNLLKIKSNYNRNLQDYKFKIVAIDTVDPAIETSALVKVVSGI